jgi:hypothetical protein
MDQRDGRNSGAVPLNRQGERASGRQGEEARGRQGEREKIRECSDAGKSESLHFWFIHTNNNRQLVRRLLP